MPGAATGAFTSLVTSGSSSRRRGLFRAVAAPAEDGEMRPVEGEPALVAQPPFQVVGERRRRVDHSAAVVANDMHVVVLGGTESGCAVVEMGVSHEPELLEQLERAVDGGEVD